jgi:GxxExxY protein
VVTAKARKGRKRRTEGPIVSIHNGVQGGTMDSIWKLCDRIREISYAIHVYLGPGHFERVYENALAHRLRKTEISFSQQCPITILDEDGALLGDYLADFLVEGRLIVELKAARSLSAEHESQLLGYLRASEVEHGLLINFGSFRFQIRKFARSKGVHTARRSCRG